MQSTNFDFLYPALIAIVGIVMIFSPRTFMRGAKYDEESIKTESWVKKTGIGLIIVGIGYAIYIYMGLHA